MEISVLHTFFFLLFLIPPTSIKAQPPSANPPTTQCSHGSPKLHFPFHFNLSCSENTTRIHFKSYDSLSVKSISYDKKRLDLADLNGCVHGVFLQLNLSLTPFRYFYAVKDYLYLNCTARLATPVSVPCLSRDGDYYVYVVKVPLMEEAPRFCREVKRVGIPFEYSPYLDDGSFGLALTWGFENQTKTGRQTECFLKATNHQVLSISFLVAMVAISMVIMKIYQSKRQNNPKEEADNKLIEHSYQALKTGSDDPANHTLV